ncbi:MAG: enoyl-CoA hydratase-related protein [Chloroflexi bacterium]|nr:enoyl-CoA hydratase-related protein [Chloroflexota bacterium]
MTWAVADRAWSCWGQFGALCGKGGCVVEFHDVLVTKHQRIGRIILNRPQVMNAVRPQSMHEILLAVTQMEEDPEVAVILISGSGQAFSVGAEFAFLDELKGKSPLEIKDTIYRFFQGAVKKVALCPKPTVAAVKGFAITVGCELALACDFRVAGESADFRESWIKLGLIPPLGGMFLLPRLIGLARARSMILTGRPVLATEAEQIGLVDQVVPDDDLEQEVLAFARMLAQLPPLGYATAKEGIRRGLESTMDREWAANVLAQGVLLNSSDFQEGLAAVKEKRKPVFQGM